jgi:hypothetical protein
MKSLFALLLLTVLASVVPRASAQSVTLTTPDDPVGDAVETTEDTLGDLSPGEVSPQGSLNDSTDRLGNSAGDAVDSGTASAGISPGKAFRSRFDRLPSRLERLLERIELGRNVRANLRRLEHELASLTARERARLLRLVNGEIRRLRADGVSRAVRKRIDRLIRARAKMTTLSGPTTLSPPTPISGLAGARTGNRATGPAPGMYAPFAGGFVEASAVRTPEPPSRVAAPPSGGGGDPSAPSKLSDPPASPLTEILLALCAVLLAILGALAIKEERSA